MVYRVLRDGVVVADGLTDATYTDADAPESSTCQYRVEHWDGAIAGWAELSVDTPGPPQVHTLVANKEVTNWIVLPTTDPDNGSLALVDEYVRDEVPYLVDTRTNKEVDVETADFYGDEDEDVWSRFQLRHETRTVYVYEADFEWNRYAPVGYFVDVLTIKGNQLADGGAFRSFMGETLTALPTLDTSNLTTFEYFFNSMPAFNQSVGHLDLSQCKTLNSIFNHSPKFNQPLPWDTSKVEVFSRMFGRGDFDQPLDHWDVSNGKNFFNAFFRCPANPDISGWDMSSATEVEGFGSESGLDQDLSGWCVENVKNVDPVYDNPFWGSPMADKKSWHPKWGQAC